jgi:hypothetical protein
VSLGHGLRPTPNSCQAKGPREYQARGPLTTRPSGDSTPSRARPWDRKPLRVAACTLSAPATPSSPRRRSIPSRRRHPPGVAAASHRGDAGKSCRPPGDAYGANPVRRRPHPGQGRAGSQAFFESRDNLREWSTMSASPGVGRAGRLGIGDPDASTLRTWAERRSLGSATVSGRCLLRLSSANHDAGLVADAASTSLFCPHPTAAISRLGRELRARAWGHVCPCHLLARSRPW